MDIPVNFQTFSRGDMPRQTFLTTFFYDKAWRKSVEIMGETFFKFKEGLQQSMIVSTGNCLHFKKIYSPSLKMEKCSVNP